MTLEERNRAKKLEKLSRDYEKHIITRKGVMKVIIIIMALLYIIWFSAGVSECIPSTHVFFSIIIISIYTEDNVGDGGAPNGGDIGLPVIGSSGTGTFLCTLPFKAKDILNMRFRRFEINLAFINIVALLNQVLFIIMFGGIFPSGYCIALLLLAELLYTVTMFIRHYQVKLYSNIVLMMLFIIFSSSAFVSNTEMYNDALPLMETLQFLSGWTGVAALIIIPILISAVGEIYLKNKKDPSWHLR